MTTTPKPPTPQAISALLRKAGFSRSTSSTTGIKGWHNYSSGYVVKHGDEAGVVWVSYRDGSFRATDETRARGTAALGDFEAAIVAAGFAVSHGTRMWDDLIVTAPADTEGEGR
jgi:hypothetical protein